MQSIDLVPRDGPDSRFDHVTKFVYGNEGLNEARDSVLAYEVKSRVDGLTKIHLRVDSLNAQWAQAGTPTRKQIEVWLMQGFQAWREPNAACTRDNECLARLQAPFEPEKVMLTLIGRSHIPHPEPEAFLRRRAVVRQGTKPGDDLGITVALPQGYRHDDNGHFRMLTSICDQGGGVHIGNPDNNVSLRSPHTLAMSASPTAGKAKGKGKVWPDTSKGRGKGNAYGLQGRLGRSQQLINDRWSDSEANSVSDNSPDTSLSPRSAAMRPANAQHVSRTRDSFGWRTLGSRPQDFGLRRDAAHRHYDQMRAGHFHHEGPCSASERRPVNRINPYGLPLYPIYEAHEYVNRRHPVE